jgi:hypothetical protein
MQERNDETLNENHKPVSPEHGDDSLLLSSSPKLGLCSLDEEEKDIMKSSPLQLTRLQSHHTPSWDDYIVDQLLGEGAYGKVFKVYKKG